MDSGGVFTGRYPRSGAEISGEWGCNREEQSDEKGKERGKAEDKAACKT